jgi:hypothetical protein
MILLIFACPLSAALLLAILAIARRPTSLLALLLVELGIFLLVLDRGNAVGILHATSIATPEAALFS